VCVPTPLGEHKQPDTSYIEDATQSIAEHLRTGQLVVLKSTTYPRTTEGVMQPILDDVAAEKEIEQIRFADPHVETLSVDTGEDESVEMPRVEVTEEVLGTHDVAVLLTDHDDFPYETISDHLPTIINARNGFDDVADK